MNVTFFSVLRCCATLSLGMAVAATTKADVVTDFTFSSSVPLDATSVSGTVDIDITTGLVTFGDIVLHDYIYGTPGGSPFDVEWSDAPSSQHLFNAGAWSAAWSAYGTARLIFGTPSLIGFDGGDADLQMSLPSYYDTPAFIHATVHLAPSSAAVPEPGSVAIWIALIGLAVGRRGQKILSRFTSGLPI